jgi:hypothetical protein
MRSSDLLRSAVKQRLGLPDIATGRHPPTNFAPIAQVPTLLSKVPVVERLAGHLPLTLQVSQWRDSSRTKAGMAPNASQLTAISRLFSLSVYREMAKRGRSPVFARLLCLTGLKEAGRPDALVGDVFDSALPYSRRPVCGMNTSIGLPSLTKCCWASTRSIPRAC